MPYLIAYLAAVNTATFFAYAYDKHAARKHKRRIRERTLHLLALLGGSPAALAGMCVFRHKTAKRGFKWVYWGIVTMQILLISFLLMTGTA